MWPNILHRNQMPKYGYEHIRLEQGVKVVRDGKNSWRLVWDDKKA